MTLARLSERLEEAKNKEGKIDGRRFNSRSQMKMKWEIRGIARALNKQKKRSTAGLHRGIYTKEEMEESRIEQESVKKEIKEGKSVKEEIIEEEPIRKMESSKNISKK